MRSALKLQTFIFALLLLIALMSLTACGCGNASFDSKGAVVNVPPKGYVSPTQLVLREENSYRSDMGQPLLTQGGLSCTLYTVTGGDRIQASIAGHNTLQGITRVATFLTEGFNQSDSNISEGMNVLPLAFRPIYLNMYFLDCNGSLIIPEDGYYAFELTTDDGGLLTVDGELLADTDNNHAALTKAGLKYLRRGVHYINLRYAQTGAGKQALILRGAGPSSTGYSVIQPEYFAH